MASTSTIVIGAGQAGLAVSHSLSALGVDHVVLERGKVAERWRSESWDSQHLLTPNWMTRLPGFQYHGGDPDGFMSIPELVAFFERYASIARAPILTGTTVEEVERSGHHFRVATSRGAWTADAVVIATGFCAHPRVPDVGLGLASSRRAYPWLHLPVLDKDGEIVHQGGITAVPGLYVLGMPFQRHRNSSFIDGVGNDARVIAQAIAGVGAGVPVVRGLL